MRLSLFLSLFLSFSFSFSRSLNVTRARHSRLATEGEGSRNARALFLLLSRSGLNREESRRGVSTSDGASRCPDRESILLFLSASLLRRHAISTQSATVTKTHSRSATSSSRMRSIVSSMDEAETA